jgi:hypothetical protein
LRREKRETSEVKYGYVSKKYDVNKHATYYSRNRGGIRDF